MNRFIPYSCLFLIGFTYASSAAHSQTTPTPPGGSPVRQASFVPTPKAANRDLSKLPIEQRAIYLSAQRGANWLRLANKPDGRFVYGFIPALRTTIEGDSVLAQAGAAQALARSAKFFQDDAMLATSRQAVLTLFDETEAHPRDARIRYTSKSTAMLNRLAGAGGILLAIYELPAPSDPLLAQAEQLGNFIRICQREDGALLQPDSPDNDPLSESNLAAAGLALQGVLAGNDHKPAPWRVEFVRKAKTFYDQAWQRSRTLSLVKNLTPAYAAAYRQSKDQTFADAVYSMTDWLITLQYGSSVGSTASWAGGFQQWSGDKAVALPPDIRSAEAALALAEACRAVRVSGDLQRFRTYSQALSSSLVFLQSLQYTESRVSHYVESFRPAVTGGFHASTQDGNLRIDYAQYSLLAMVDFCIHVAEWQP